jgi:hypothetical protein
MDIFKMYFNDDWLLIIELSPIIIVLLVLIFILYRFFLKKKFGLTEYEIDEAEIGLGNNKVKVKPNYEDMQVAYQLYVELSTRKIGLPIDFEDDFLIEIYDSWFEFFKITREHIKSIPAQKIRRSPTTRAILKIAIEVLNEGIRPHLTKWQARFRKWYEIHSATEDFKSSSPQDLQSKFPEFEKLVSDMKLVNGKLMQYRKMMKKISIGLES